MDLRRSVFFDILRKCVLCPNWRHRIEDPPPFWYRNICKGTDNCNWRAVCKQLCRMSQCGCIRVFGLLNACVIELSRQRISRKPVVSHVTAGLKANTRINRGTYNNDSWKMEQRLFFHRPPNQSEVVYHIGRMFGCLPCTSALGP